MRKIKNFPFNVSQDCQFPREYHAMDYYAHFPCTVIQTPKSKKHNKHTRFEQPIIQVARWPLPNCIDENSHITDVGVKFLKKFEEIQFFFQGGFIFWGIVQFSYTGYELTSLLVLSRAISRVIKQCLSWKIFFACDKKNL